MNAATLPPALHELHEFPIDIVDHQASGVLELCWQDGSTSRLAHGLLRARCRCAACERAFRECVQRKNRSLAQSEHTATAMTGEVA